MIGGKNVEMGVVNNQQQAEDDSDDASVSPQPMQAQESVQSNRSAVSTVKTHSGENFFLFSDTIADESISRGNRCKLFLPSFVTLYIKSFT